MLRQTGETYQSSEFAKALCASEAKVGKTTFLVAGCLGVLPWQKYGGLVDKPEHLHVITFDANAAGGLKKFLVETCSAPTEALKFDILNLQDDLRRVSVSNTEYDYTLFNAVFEAVNAVGEAAGRGGVHVLLMSSLTGLGQGLERAVGGGLVDGRKGGNMDQSKWSTFSQQMSEVRNYAQVDKWHTLWEAHLYKPQATGQNKDDAPPKETLQISGKTGQNFAYNVEQVFRIRRLYNQVFPSTKCDKTYFDTRPSLDFVSGGRSFTESLDPTEADITLAFHKLGLKIGRWGHKPKAKAK
jgi:hypothetical protein